jgi:hypothetical protein
MTRKSRTARDTGLRQVKTATKLLAGAAAVLTGFFAVWEARSVHEASAATPTPAATQSPSPSPGSGTLQPAPTDPGYSTGDLQAPDYAPAPSYQPPAASSGGS